MKFTYTKGIVLSVIFCVALIYFALGTGFGFSFRHVNHSGYYGLLLDAFEHGQLHIRVKPDPHLLKMKAPYSPEETKPYRVQDATLHDGKYYFYWGPVPAFMRALLLDNMHESFYSFLYILGCAVVSLLILFHLRKHYFQAVKNRWLLLLYMYFIFNGSVLYLLGCVGIYYEAIAAGQFFLLLGLYNYLISLTLEHNKRKHTIYLLLTSLFLGLSVGSRVSFAPTALFVFGYEVYRLRPHFNWKKVLAIGVPLLTFLGLLGLYNFLRFGSFLDFGIKEQLLGPLYPTFEPMASLQNIPNNIKNYFFSIPSHTMYPPYITTNPLRYILYERVIASVGILSPLLLLIFLPVQCKQAQKTIYTFFIAGTGITVMVLFYLMPYSPIRYFFDIIFLLNFVAAIKTMAALEQYKKYKAIAVKIYLVIALAMLFSYGWAFWLYAIREYHVPSYFGYNQKVFKDHNMDRRYIDPFFNNPQFTDDVLLNAELKQQ